MERDFTLRKYKELCEQISNTNYKTLSVSDYLRNIEEYQNAKFIIIRHDIDNKVDLPVAVKMAEFESSLGIRSSYYFRFVENVFRKECIKTIYQLNQSFLNSQNCLV